MVDEKKNGELNPSFVDIADENANADGQGYGKWDMSPVGPDSNAAPSTPKMAYDLGEERRMLRNIIVTSCSFTLLFTAFQSMSNLQSSFNAADGLGNYVNGTIYGSIIVSCMFLPTYLISKFTVKWTLVFAIFGYTAYIAAQMKPEFYMLIPFAVVVGFCAAPLWSAKCTYLTHVGHQYAAITSGNAEVVVTRFFGIFFFAFQTSNIWGNLISSLVIGAREEADDISLCGSTFCPEDASNGTLEKVDDSTKYTLTGIYVGCSLAAIVILSLFLDPLTRYGEKEREGDASKLTGNKLFFATFQQMKKPYQLLIIPLTMWSGMEQGFINADYTQAYISCAWGIGKIGYVMICYGVCDCISSVCFGPLIRYTGRAPIFIFGALVNVGVIIALFIWEPNPDNPVIFFVLAGLWGIGDGIWQTQINALYGVLFPQNEEAAFSNYRLWESLGFVIAYINSNLACVNAKLYSLLGVLALGLVGFLIVEFMEHKVNKSKPNKH